MKKITSLLRTICLLGITLALAQVASAVPVSITYVGTWQSTASGNTDPGGPGLIAGQKYVIRIFYDDTSFVTTGVDVLDSSFSASGNFMQTIDLTAAGNSLDIFAPMEGLDAGSPVIYTQNETNHFFYGPNSTVPTLNFVDGTNISNTANIIGLEFEGNFDPSANFNIIELFNTAPSGGTTNMVSSVLNCGDASCFALAAPAANDTQLDTPTNGTGFDEAVGLIVDAGPNLVYDAATLTQTTSSTITQSNDLGAMRSDNEDFIDASWVQTGTAAGTNLNDIAVQIANSGLMNTLDTATWNVTMDEQMTLGSDSGSLIVSYMNALPTASATATANGSDTDFTLNTDDVDLAINAFIANFETRTVTALVGGTDATAFFADLILNGIQSYTNFELEVAFGAGAHTVVFTASDFAGAIATASANFDVDQVAQVPEPGTLVLMMLGLFALAISRRRPLFAEL